MQRSESVNVQKRYLLRSEDPHQLLEALGLIASTKGAQVVDEIGPPGNPHTIVVMMTDEQAKDLERRLNKGVILEPDRPLSLFSNTLTAPPKTNGGSHGESTKARKHVEKQGEKKTTHEGSEMAHKPDQPSAAQPSNTPPSSAPAQPPQVQPQDVSPGRAGGGPSSPPGAAPTPPGPAPAPPGAAAAPPGPAPAPPGPAPAPPGPAPAGGPPPQSKVLKGGKNQFVIAPRRLAGMQPMGLQPLAFNFVEQALRTSPDIEVVDTLGPKGLVATLADGMGGTPNVIVAKMTDEKAGILKQQAGGQLIVERDQPLQHFQPETQPPTFVMPTVPQSGPVLAAPILVLGPDNKPVAEAEVILFGSMLPARGVTDQKGEVTLTLFGETVQSLRGLYVKPKADFWSFYQERPDIDSNQQNVVVLRSFSETSPGFPKQQLLGWGQKAMRLDQLPGNYRGQGVKVAIIDSGAATTHQDLTGIKFGFDVINKKTDVGTWNQDVVQHGSHCAGIIAGADNSTGIRGFAPDAEIHACKLFPGGQFSQLIDALEYCIEKQIDVANLSLGGAEASEALEQQILRAKRLGVACIVAAGNSGGDVQYPAKSPNVLAVAAVGKLGEFPPDSYHAQTITNSPDPNGYFSPKFTCFGPEVGVCGPGVAILSSIPPDNFAAWDGTSMATPHITGLAALILAHHPDFQTTYKARGPERVDRLFQILKASARPINVGDARKTGFGLPDVLIALGLQQRAGAPQAAGTSPQNFPGAPLGSAIGGIGSFAPASAGPFNPMSTDPFGPAYAQQAQPGNYASYYMPLSPFAMSPLAAYVQSMNPFAQMAGGLGSFGFRPNPYGYGMQAQGVPAGAGVGGGNGRWW